VVAPVRLHCGLLLGLLLLLLVLLLRILRGLDLPFTL